MYRRCGGSSIDLPSGLTTARWSSEERCDDRRATSRHCTALHGALRGAAQGTISVELALLSPILLLIYLGEIVEIWPGLYRAAQSEPHGAEQLQTPSRSWRDRPCSTRSTTSRPPWRTGTRSLAATSSCTCLGAATGCQLVPRHVAARDGDPGSRHVTKPHAAAEIAAADDMQSRTKGHLPASDLDAPAIDARCESVVSLCNCTFWLL